MGGVELEAWGGSRLFFYTCLKLVKEGENSNLVDKFLNFKSKPKDFLMGKKKKHVKRNREEGGTDGRVEGEDESLKKLP